MTDSQENKFEMFLVVRNVLQQHTAAWQGLPVFVTTVDTYQKQLTKLENVAQERGEATAGVTQAKAEARAALAEAAFPLAAGLQAFAAIEGNIQLAALIAFTRSDFLYGRDNLSLQKARTTRTTVKEHLPALAAYGINLEMVKNLTTAIDRYANLLEAPRTAIAERAAATAQIAELIDTLDALLKDRLDKLVPILAPRHPTFADAYRTARVIIDRAGPARDPEDVQEEPPTDQ